MADKWEYCDYETNQGSTTFHTPEKSWTVSNTNFVKQTGMAPRQWLLASGYEPFAVTSLTNINGETRKVLYTFKRKYVQMEG